MVKLKNPCQGCKTMFCNNILKNCPICWKCKAQYSEPLKNHLCDLCQKVENQKQKTLEVFIKT